MKTLAKTSPAHNSPTFAIIKDYLNEIPCDSINITTHPKASEIQKNPQTISNLYNVAFRMTGITYKPQ